MGEYITVLSDYYLDYQHGKTIAKIPGIVAITGESEYEVNDMLQKVFHFILIQWQVSNRLFDKLHEEQFEFTGIHWQRTLPNSNGAVEINLEVLATTT